MLTKEELNALIDEKIELLRDFCVLSRASKKNEDAVRKILATCKTEVQVEQKVHNLIVRKETLKEFIQRNSAALVV